MSREVDRRDFAADEATPERVAELRSAAREISERLPGDHWIAITQFDRTTGVPRVITSEAAPPEAENYVERALDHVQAIAPAFGLVRTRPEYVPDEQVQHTSSGAAVVHLQQNHLGIPIFQATETVRFNPDGSLRDATGSSEPVDGAAEAEPDPALSVEDAVRRAAEHVARPEDDERDQVDQFGVPVEPPEVDLSGFAPRLEAHDRSPQRQATLSGEPFEDIRAQLFWFPMFDALHLAWETLLTFPDFVARYRVLVDAGDGEILYSRQLVQTFAVRGNVYPVDGSTPRVMTDFPLPAASYTPQPIPGPPPNFPEDWLTRDETSGNSTHAHLGSAGPPMRGVRQGASLTFDPADDSGDDQKVLNIFYFNCYMHDYCYLLGFREADGNFQQDNFGRGGIDGDPVDARAHSGAVTGTANMATLEDGRPPVMNMGLVPSTERHTAFDSSVVFHEFMHGVTNRMVGGPADSRSLDSPQSRGMGEGWSDWIACTINANDVVGAWVIGDPGGIRNHPYDANYPDDFGDLGSGIYAPGADEHNVGELWCATLMSLNRTLGSPLALQLVVDALRLAAANPSFLNMRDDILTAADLMDAAGKLEQPLEDVRSDIWSVFARDGMGPSAQSQGAQLVGIVADFTAPAD